VLEILLDDNCFQTAPYIPRINQLIPMEGLTKWVLRCLLQQHNNPSHLTSLHTICCNIYGTYRSREGTCTGFRQQHWLCSIALIISTI